MMDHEIYPSHMEDTETWSVYVAAQKKVIAAMRKKALKDARILWAYNPAQECYCKQPRVDRRIKYIRPRKPKKKLVKICWSRLRSNRSFPGIHCARVQKPLMAAPRYQHPAGSGVPPLLAHHKHHNPLWTGLADYAADTAAQTAEKARRDVEPKPSPEMMKPGKSMVLSLSVKPGDGLRSVSTGSPPGPSQVSKLCAPNNATIFGANLIRPL